MTTLKTKTPRKSEVYQMYPDYPVSSLRKLMNCIIVEARGQERAKYAKTLTVTEFIQVQEVMG